MKEWVHNIKKYTTKSSANCCHEWTFLLTGEVNHKIKKALKVGYKSTSSSMVALIWKAGEDYLKFKMVKGGVKTEYILTTQCKSSPTLSRRRILLNSRANVHFNQVTLEPLKIQGRPIVDPWKVIRTKAMDHLSFAIMDFRNIMRNSLEGTMSTPFYEPFPLQVHWVRKSRIKETWGVVVDYERQKGWTCLCCLM